MEDKKEKELVVEVPKDIELGVYSNLILVNHSPSEFVIDFAQMMPGYTKPRVCSRAIVSPIHAKRFLHALKQNLVRYEKEHGKIEESIDNNNIDLSLLKTKGEA